MWENRRQQLVLCCCIPQQTVSSDSDPDTSERGMVQSTRCEEWIPSRTEAHHSKVWFCWHHGRQPNKIHSHPRPNNMDWPTVLVLIHKFLRNFWSVVLCCQSNRHDVALVSDMTDKEPINVHLDGMPTDLLCQCCRGISLTSWPVVVYSKSLFDEGHITRMLPDFKVDSLWTFPVLPSGPAIHRFRRIQWNSVYQSWWSILTTNRTFPLNVISQAASNAGTDMIP